MNQPSQLSRTLDGRQLPEVGDWAFEAGNSNLTFRVKHMMISKVRGSFREFSGHIHVAADPCESTVRADILAASIDTGMSYRDKDLKSSDFLDVTRHPHLQFISTAIRPGSNDWIVTGDLTIAAVTNPVELRMEFGGTAVDPWGNAKAAFTATTRIIREDFGLTYNKAIEGGGVLIGSTIDIDIEIQAKPTRLG